MQLQINVKVRSRTRRASSPPDQIGRTQQETHNRTRVPCYNAQQPPSTQSRQRASRHRRADARKKHSHVPARTQNTAEPPLSESQGRLQQSHATCARGRSVGRLRRVPGCREPGHTRLLRQQQASHTGQHRATLHRCCTAARLAMTRDAHTRNQPLKQQKSSCRRSPGAGHMGTGSGGCRWLSPHRWPAQPHHGARAPSHRICNAAALPAV